MGKGEGRGWDRVAEGVRWKRGKGVGGGSLVESWSGVVTCPAARPVGGISYREFVISFMDLIPA